MKAADTRKNYVNKAWGYKYYKVLVHEKDIGKVIEFAKTLEMARKLQEGKL